HIQDQHSPSPLLRQPPPRARHFPYTTLFRSSLSDTHYGPASGIFRASPEHIASISTALGGTLDHGGIALRAAGHLRLLWGHEGGRCGRRFAWLTLVLSYPLFEDGPLDQLDITARCKVLRFLGEPAGSDDKTDRKSTRLNSSHVKISYAGICLK